MEKLKEQSNRNIYVEMQGLTLFIDNKQLKTGGKHSDMFNTKILGI